MGACNVQGSFAIFVKPVPVQDLRDSNLGATVLKRQMWTIMWSVQSLSSGVAGFRLVLVLGSATEFCY
jgi:hypothetical protein